MDSRFITLVCFVLFSIQPAWAGSESAGAQELVEAARSFLSELDEAQQALVLRSFEDIERTDWHYVPKDRKGLSLADMSEDQRHSAWAFLETALSDRGLAKAQGVIAAERFLWEKADHSDFRNPEKYYFVFFGQPTAEGDWAASFEGHHLSINLTVLDGHHVFLTPSFFGANPDETPSGQRPLAAEFEQAFALLQMLDVVQLKGAQGEGKPSEIRTRAHPQVERMAPSGLAVSAMTPQQQSQLMLLIREYVGRYRDAFAEDDLQKIEAAGIDSIHFLWLGKASRGGPVYYRVQGPSFVLEYANLQNGANHAHTVWRDFDNDFGYDALRHHLESDHQ